LEKENVQVRENELEIIDIGNNNNNKKRKCCFHKSESIPELSE
jgi:hypothetical protein